ncbi:MAG: hypothetical protein WCF31_10520 [Candidatus Deferrimicrobiaceae bacterium]
MRAVQAAFALLLLMSSVGCSPRAYVLGRVADGISAGGGRCLPPTTIPS